MKCQKCLSEVDEVESKSRYCMQCEIERKIFIIVKFAEELDLSSYNIRFAAEIMKNHEEETLKETLE